MFNAEFGRTLGELVAEAMNDPEAFEEAECLYRQTFRGAAITKGAEVVASGNQGFIDYLLGEMVCVDTVHPEDDKQLAYIIEHEIDCWFEPRIIKHAPSREEGMEILETLEFYEVCNYKGEGEGFVLRTPETDKLPVFHSKYNYEGF